MGLAKAIIVNPKSVDSTAVYVLVSCRFQICSDHDAVSGSYKARHWRTEMRIEMSE